MATVFVACGSEAERPDRGDGGSAGAATGGGAGEAGRYGSGAVGGSSGASSAGASTGTGGGNVGTACAEGGAGVVWAQLAGTYPMVALALGESADGVWTVGNTYDVTVDAASCAVVFETDGSPEVCQWTGSGWDYAGETVENTTLTIHIQDVVEQPQSTRNLCELNYRIDLGKMGVSSFFFPKTQTGTAFDSP